MNFTELEKCKELTEEQVRIFSILKSMQQKTTIMWFIIWAFVLVLLTFLTLILGLIKTDWQSKSITGFLDGILGYTIYPLVKHYFPAEKIAKTIEKLKRK